MMNEPLFPPLVFTVWTIGLAITLLVFVPLSVVLLHRLWRTARSIQSFGDRSQWTARFQRHLPRDARPSTFGPS